FGPDGNLYVSSYGTNEVLRYQGPSGAQPGAFIDVFIPAGDAGLFNPTGVTFGPDGNLYVSSRATNSVVRSGITPDFYGVTVNAGDSLVIQTTTPAGDPQQPFEFHNQLDPA